VDSEYTLLSSEMAMASDVVAAGWDNEGN